LIIAVVIATANKIGFDEVGLFRTLHDPLKNGTNDADEGISVCREGLSFLIFEEHAN
jgi:hypothetical protein